jgi:hypothetical protein
VKFVDDDNTEAEEMEENDQNMIENDLQPDGDEAEIAENEENEEENEDGDANPVGVNDNNSENDDGDKYNETLYDYELAQTTQKTRSGCTAKAPECLNFVQSHIFTQGHKETSYSLVTAQVIAKTMDYFNNLVLTTKKDRKYSFLVTYSLKKGLKTFGKREMMQH